MDSLRVKVRSIQAALQFNIKSLKISPKKTQKEAFNIITFLLQHLMSLVLVLTRAETAKQILDEVKRHFHLKFDFSQVLGFQAMHEKNYCLVTLV